MQIDNKRAAGAFLLRYLGADDVLADMVREAERSGDSFHLENFQNHIDKMETALSEGMDAAKLLKEDIAALRGRLAWEKMGGVDV